MIETPIEDPADERLADYVDLTDAAARRLRERDEIFVIEGLVALERLVESGHVLRSVLVIPRKLAAVEALLGDTDIPVLVAAEGVVARTVGFHFHRGVAAVAERRPLPGVAAALTAAHRVAVLVGLNDPENLGLIARSARAFGIDALLLDPTCIDPYYRRTVRVSMGEVLLLTVARFDTWPAGLGILHDAGFETWAMTPAAGATSIWDVAVPARLAIVLGAEGPGLADSTLRHTTRQVRIPIDPAVDSINVGHAAAVTFAVTARDRPPSSLS